MKLELLAPAGDPEKLKIAVLYGADAVYFGGEAFSLRSGAGNFSLEEMREGIAYAHAHGVKCYLTLNIYPHNEDIAPMEAFLDEIRGIPVDAFLVSDPGAMMVLKEHIPDAVIHLSTQANMTNYRTAQFWYGQGVRRVVTAREMSLAEISQMRGKLPEDMEIEAFVHGAMCVSYSGRCLLSNFMTGRDANRGECAHPCRWKYALVEEQRPGVYWPVEEDAHGSYILNSGDLCMIEHIPELAQAGVTSFKIEGRMKSIFYLASVVAQYRKAIDAAERILEGIAAGDVKGPAAGQDEALAAYRQEAQTWLAELGKASHRTFTTGFYFGKPDASAHNYETSSYVRDYTFIGLVLGYDGATGEALVEQRNKMSLGEQIEVFGPQGESFSQTLGSMKDAESGEPVEAAPHPQQHLLIRMDQPVSAGSMLRREKLVK